uniref:ORF171 n=1 Tax=Cyanidiococcus yangmingshanensis TaxID=2690220 RepID=A0A7G5VUI5_9RHOD|nr:ORF171 [Cyanidiococcus yangmingshanensis]QMX77352.1 ORF171 [Cyanidiococcus yangmingshanensis]
MKKFVVQVPIEILTYVGTIVTIKGYKYNQYIVETDNGYRFWVFQQEIST